MRRLAHLSIRFPGPVLIVAAVLTLATASGLVRLQLRTDGQALVPTAAPEVVVDRAMRRTFGVRDLIAVVIRADHPDGIFNPASLRRIEALSAALRQLDGVRPHDVTSLATERGFRREAGLMDFRTLLDPFPETAAALAQLRDDLRRIALYEGILVSTDGSSAAVLLGTPPEADRAALVRRIEELASASDGTGTRARRESVMVLGAPAAEALLGHHILADLGVPERLLGATGRGAWDVDAAGEGGTLLPRPLGMVPVAIAVMGLVFLVAFRRPAAAMLPLGEVAVCLAIVFGMMGWLGVPIYLTTAVLPVILTAVGVADEIHIFRHYLDLGPSPHQSDAEHRRLVRTTLDAMTPPVVATSITTAVAFLSFSLSPLGPVRAFGLFTALGVMICMLYSLTVVPALLVVLGPARFVRRRRGDVAGTPDGAGAAGTPRLARLAVFGARHRRAVLGVALVVALLSLDGVRRLEVQDSWIDGFAPASAFARATRFFDQQFLGAHLLLVEVEVDAPRLEGAIPAEALGRDEVRLPAPSFVPGLLDGSWIRLSQREGAAPRTQPARDWTTWIDGVRSDDGQVVLAMPPRGGSARAWLHPQSGETLDYEIWSEPLLAPPTLRRIDALEEFLAARAGVGGVLGPARYLQTVRFMLQPERDDSRRLPADPGEARVLWSNYAMVRGAERRSQVVDPTYRQALVTVFLRDSNFADTARLLAEVRGFEREHLAGHGIRLAFGGDVAVSEALIEAVVSTQVRSVLFSLVGILVVAAVLSRSLRWGMYCVLPPSCAVLANFAVMGWTGIPLGVATSMFACMTLGVGVDYAIHLLARYRLVMAERAGSGGADAMSAPAIAVALASTGPAILIDALAVALGFGILVLSQVPANARLGGLLVASILASLGATLALVPALLARPGRAAI